MGYITVGALTIVWTSIWFAYLSNHPPETDHPYYWVSGCMATGITLLIIGISIGSIGRASRPAEAPAARTNAGNGAAPPAGTPMMPAAVPAPAVTGYPGNGVPVQPPTAMTAPVATTNR